MTVKTWDQAEKALSERMPGFRTRPQQRMMAESVQRTVNGNSNHPVLLAQAGCGVGKSLGYLIPALTGGGRVIVSVSTKALQDQLVSKDLPMLADTLFPGLTFATLKGRSNYVCQRAADRSGTRAEVRPGSAGERQDLVSPVPDEVWSQISVDSEGCVGKGCPFRDRCYSERAKKKATESRVLVVNTSLLTQDLRFRGMTRGNASLLGDFDFLVVDEAHEMPDIVASGLSTRISFRRITDVTAKLAYHLDSKAAPAKIAQLNETAAAYFNTCKAWFDQQDAKIRTAEMSSGDYDSMRGMADLMGWLHAQVMDAACSCEPLLSPDGEMVDQCEYARRVDTLFNDLEMFAVSETSINVVWMERTRTGNVALMSSPAEVGGFLASTLWNPKFCSNGTADPVYGDQDKPTYPIRAVLTSATLGVGGDFEYMSRRLGLGERESLDVGTPFDFQNQARLYLPPADAPNPSKQYAQWKGWAQQQMLDLVSAAGGGALILFTSTAAMREAHAALKTRIRRITGAPVYLQGDTHTNQELNRLFSGDTHSVLFATRSFMTGVDFSGDTCRLVVIDKMPFPVPDEPVFKARCQASDDRFGPRSSFGRVSIPEMSLVLIQAFGRLIRTVDDTGVVAILDPRMRAGWASPIRRSLPPAPLADSVESVRAFYSELTLRVS
jgi:ATP-dependent DNA helicase DinG